MQHKTTLQHICYCSLKYSSIEQYSSLHSRGLYIVRLFQINLINRVPDRINRNNFGFYERVTEPGTEYFGLWFGSRFLFPDWPVWAERKPARRWCWPWPRRRSPPRSAASPTSPARPPSTPSRPAASSPAPSRRPSCPVGNKWIATACAPQLVKSSGFEASIS